jgi:predicted transcriptional regulator
MTTSKAVKLDDDTYTRLKEIGKNSRRSPHWLMKEAIKQFIDREDEAENIRKDTVARLQNFEANGAAIKFSEIEAWLSTWGDKK